MGSKGIVPNVVMRVDMEFLAQSSQFLAPTVCQQTSAKFERERERVRGREGDPHSPSTRTYHVSVANHSYPSGQFVKHALVPSKLPGTPQCRRAPPPAAFVRVP